MYILFESGPIAPREVRPWIERLAGEIASDARVRTHAVHRLMPVSNEYAAAADWLIELELTPGSDPAAVITGAACAPALHDLRQLRAHPRVHVMNPA